MKALFIVSTPERRGAELFAWRLSEELSRFGLDVTVAAIYRSPGEHQLPIETLGSKRWSPGGFRRLIDQARGNDVLISNGGDTLLPTTLAAAITKRPFVYRNIGDPTVWGSIPLADLRIGAPLRRASAIAALYPDAGSEISRRYRIPSEKVRLISNAAPDSAYAPVEPSEKARLQAQLGLDPSRIWVGFVGALSPEKQPLLALEAVREDHRLGIVVAGDGPLLSACRDHAASSPPGSVHLIGSRRDLAEVYGAIDVLVIPSATEGVPAVAIEAGLCGLPVVATSVGGMGYVVHDDATGLLVTNPTPRMLAEKLVEAADRPELGVAGRVRCREHFTMGPIAARWAELLSDVTQI